MGLQFLSYIFAEEKTMFNFSNLKNRPVLSKLDLCIIGHVADCLLSENLDKVEYFLCINNGENFLVSIDGFSAINDAVVLEDRALVRRVNDVDFTALHSVLEKDVFSDNGQRQGVVTDATFMSSGKVTGLLLGDKILKPAEISGVGEILLLKPPAKKRKKKRVVNLTTLAVEDSPVSILDTPASALLQAMREQETGNHTVDIQSASQPSLNNTAPHPNLDNYTPSSVPITQDTPVVTARQEQVPPRIISDYNFLLGRQLTADLYGYDGDLMGYKGAPITTTLVDLARAKGKLLELTYNSR